MSIESVSGTDLQYHLIAFDADGNERQDDPDGIMSDRVAQTIHDAPVTDVFLISHGWQGDIPAAKDQYNRWIGAMAQCPDDIAAMRARRPGFMPLVIGLHWPSLPWGDEDFASGTASFDAPESAGLDALIERYASRIASTPAAIGALRTLLEAAEDDIAPAELPPQVVEAYLTLNREAGLGGSGVAGAPGADREPFDPQRAYRASLDEAVDYGGFSLSGLLTPLAQLSFWKMKDRARAFGQSGGFQLLSRLQQLTTGKDVRFHLMGHSFGCIVVSATIMGPEGARLPRPVDSVALVQGALSLWSYCADIPHAKGHPGFFRRVVAEQRVAGPIITTRTEHDTAVGRFYPLGAGVAGQVEFAPGDLPKYGAVGTFGLRGPGLDVADLDMGPATQAYAFAPGVIHNLESSRYIRQKSGVAGAHSDIAHPEVAHAVWQAATPAA